MVDWVGGGGFKFQENQEFQLNILILYANLDWIL